MRLHARLRQTRKDTEHGCGEIAHLHVNSFTSAKVCDTPLCAIVIPAKAGIQAMLLWVPAFAGMTDGVIGPWWLMGRGG